MNGWSPVIAFAALCICALAGHILYGLPAVGYAVELFCLYILYWAGRQILPELWADLSKRAKREYLWWQKGKGKLTWNK